MARGGAGRTTPEELRLRSFLRVSLVTSVASTAFVAVLVVAVREPWLLPMLGIVVANVAACAAELRLLHAGRTRAAVIAYAAADWAIALVVVALVPPMLPVGASVVALPIVTAMPFLGRRGIEALAAAGAVVMLATALLGTLQDWSGLADRLPSWLLTGLVVVLLPFIWTYTALNASFTSARVSDALAGVEDANAALRVSRARLVAAGDRERRRIERNLHDGAQQRLIALRMRLGAARAAVDDPATAARLSAIDDDLRAAMDELRALSRGLYPPLLVERGLEAALRAAGDAAAVPVSLERFDAPRQPPEVEAALYFACVEAIQNASRHAGEGAHIRVAVWQDGALRVEVVDDGCGFDPAAAGGGTGLAGIADRVGAIGGTVEIRSSPGGGTRIAAVVPLSRAGT